MAAAPRRRVRRGEPIPVWRQIEIDLTFEIRTGFFGPGDRLPSESELAKAYGVHRHTVRVALARLADEGLVVARQGKGVFVARRPVEYAVTRESKWSEFEQRLAARPDGKLLRSSRRTATAELAALLAIAPGSELLVLESLRRAGPGVSAYCYHVFEHARFAGIDEAFRRLRSYTPALAELGHPEFFRTRTWIDGRLPRADEARALAVASDTPVMVMSYVDAGRDGAPILFGSAVVPAGRLRFRVDSP
ncbi:phosphonate metabolism transcriptional regulator PhnF [Rhodoplanes elegans]|uniref:Phosphonate metabolism transcriptional regulator PhnF n=1 Tax=Rhodoplanes elegans TaxID=29408 RepID=A0A327KQB1_9BRAD|nr:phosphonate metabolism transcriptional regulator PhnF [Rhodoplanes elegans]MBK5961650.1 phosphonate metabolism transcriptional regulator PhnF [Rhodoplanes elegans]RAI40076.1 phosphonate metabolism transcriptional regulator PhnF [Rhodoplanes elegans]